MSRRVVLSYCQFDPLNGHDARFLKRASALGDELIIGCATDQFAHSHGLFGLATFEQRKAVLESCVHVDRVIALRDIGQIRTDIVNYNAAIVALGADDQTGCGDLHDIAQVHLMPRYGGLFAPLKRVG